jgi:S-adenosylmethionine/arginine decarboxylase-like enzyme
VEIVNLFGGSRVQKLQTRPYAYRHIVATLFGCRADLLDDKLLLNTTLKAIQNANMQLAKTTMLNPLVYRVGDDIMGGGVSVNALITTSHLTVHTSRLYRSVEFDCATCGCESDPWASLDTFKRALKPTHVTMQYEHDDLQQHVLSVPPIKT